MAYPDGWASFSVGAGYCMSFSIPALVLSTRRVAKERAPSLITRTLARHERNPWGDLLLVQIAALVGAIAATSWDLRAIAGALTGATITALVWAAVDPVGIGRGIRTVQARDRRASPSRSAAIVLARGRYRSAER